MIAPVGIAVVLRLRYLAGGPGCACCGQVVDLAPVRGELLCAACAHRPVNEEPSS